MSSHFAFGFPMIFSRWALAEFGALSYPLVGTACKLRTVREPALLLLLSGVLMASTFSDHTVCWVIRAQNIFLLSHLHGREEMRRSVRPTNLSLFHWFTRKEQFIIIIIFIFLFSQGCLYLGLDYSPTFTNSHLLYKSSFLRMIRFLLKIR